MAVGDIVQATIRCQAGVQAGLNVRHYRSTATVGGSVPLTFLADQLYVVFNILYAALLSDQANFLGVTVQKIFPLPAMMPIPSSQAATVGLLTGDLLPRQTAGLITLRTAFAGRKFRGRAYIPFPAESVNEVDSSPTAAYVANLSTLAQNLLQPQQIADGPNTETFLPVIWHRATSTSDFLTMAQVHDAWATQRRRGSFGRPNQPEVMGPPIVPIG